MKIRAAQREAFTARAAETFPGRVRATLLTRLPEHRADLEGPGGLSRVEASIARGRVRGFVGERDACKWVVLSTLLGEAFAEEPWAAAVLADPRHATPTERVEALWAAAEERELDGVQRDLTRATR